MRDIYNNLQISQLYRPQNTTATQNSSSFDMQGYESLSIIFAIGQSGDTLSGSVNWTLSIQDSDDNSNFTEVAVEPP